MMEEGDSRLDNAYYLVEVDYADVAMVLMAAAICVGSFFWVLRWRKRK